MPISSFRTFSNQFSSHFLKARIFSTNPQVGACSSSCDSRSGYSTAKLILPDGQLQEFSGPVKVSQILHKMVNPASSFICNSDDMDFDDVVSPVGSDEVLKPGQLYFVLPANQLRRPLTAEEMASLAVKANFALKGGVVVEESDRNELKTGQEIGAGVGPRKNGNCHVGSGRRQRRVLSAIPE